MARRENRFVRSRAVVIGQVEQNAHRTEIHVERETEIDQTAQTGRVVVRSTQNPENARTIAITDPRAAALLAYVETQQAELAAADAYRHRPVTPRFKRKRTRSGDSMDAPCPHCDGRGVFDGEACIACGGLGWV